VIIYESAKSGFIDDILSNTIEKIILENYFQKTGKSVAASEILSWKESLRFMAAVLHDKEIPDDAGIAIEYHVPQTSKRIDFMITGNDGNGTDYAVLIELKQWAKAELTKKDGIVITHFRNGSAETNHPSYQVWSYAALLRGFNETVYENKVQLKPCAYLHNYKPDSVITNQFYSEYIRQAPVFLEGADEQEKLRKFIKEAVKYGDKNKILYSIEHGRIRPSKTLADSMVKLLKGNKEFILIDDQKIVYETALGLARRSSSENKSVLIVEGGPGTGKSVVAINLLVDITKAGLVAKYVSKNAAPRAVYESKLTGTLKKTEFTNLFSGSGSFTETSSNTFDALIVDEAHRLNEKSGLYRNLGENQVKEIVNAAKCSIFFIDEDQKVTFDDIGEKGEIKKWAKELGATVETLSLASQFRCNGSDGYLAWLDNVLQIRDTANLKLETSNYDFRIFDTPNELRDFICEKNKLNNSARLVAGYCWDWVSKKDKNENDIVIPAHKFAAQWNLASDGSLWLIAQDSVKEIGCIHTCQGLELDYIGVIIGEDMAIAGDKILTDPFKRAKADKSLSGFKAMLVNDPIRAKAKADRIIKNTYRALMTRGMKGCYIYCVDPELGQYFKRNLKA
jgi:uncharacterized protein